MDSVDEYTRNVRLAKLTAGTELTLPTKTTLPSDTHFPQQGESHFWDLLAQWVVIEARFGINWLTVLPALIVAYTTFNSNLVNHDLGTVIIAALLGLNAYARTTQTVSNMAKAAVRVNGGGGITVVDAPGDYF